MKTIFTVEDIKNLFKDIFEDNSEKILLIDEEDGTKTEKDIVEYLNVHFYSWKNRLVEKGDESFDEQPALSVFDAWVQSLNFSMNEAYALVEITDEEVTVSQDIDSSTKTGNITFLIQTDKVKNLDYYVSKLRNAYIGNPESIQNSYGDILKAYITIGNLMYEQEPTMTQIGECIKVSLAYRISYLNDAQTYSDTQIEISFTGDDTYGPTGEIVGTTKYLSMPITKMTWQNIIASTPIPTAERPDLTGFLATSLSQAKTLSFYDFNKTLTNQFNNMFWLSGAFRYNGLKTSVQSVNIPVYVRITNNGNTYVYKDMIDNMEKTISNNDFNVSSITLKGWGKVEPIFTILTINITSSGETSKKVTILSNTPNVTIFYTTNGNTPNTSSSQYTTTINFSSGTSHTITLKAVAYVGDEAVSDIVSETFTYGGMIA